MVDCKAVQFSDQMKCECGNVWDVNDPIPPICMPLLYSTVKRDAATILEEMSETFRERNKGYKDNYKRVGAVMEAMFPDGVVLRTVEDFTRWHLFELKIVKLTRFANSGLTHADSIHDDAVYSAMIESLLAENPEPIFGREK